MRNLCVCHFRFSSERRNACVRSFKRNSHQNTEFYEQLAARLVRMVWWARVNKHLNTGISRQVSYYPIWGRVRSKTTRFRSAILPYLTLQPKCTLAMATFFRTCIQSWWHFQPAWCEGGGGGPRLESPSPFHSIYPLLLSYVAPFIPSLAK